MKTISDPKMKKSITKGLVPFGPKASKITMDVGKGFGSISDPGWSPRAYSPTNTQTMKALKKE